MSSPPLNATPSAEAIAATYTYQVRFKTILITGVSPNGLGLYTAKTLAAHTPQLLILAARSTKALSAAQAEIKNVAPRCPIRLLTLDLSSLQKVREAVHELNGWEDVLDIDILINNAGIMSTPWGKSEDGVEMQFAVNHLGPWLFTNLIMPKIIHAKGRIVFLSSSGHTYGGVNFGDVNFDAYDPDVAYGQSKTANLLTGLALAGKLKSMGVTSFSVHPGLVLTNLSKHIPMEVFKNKGFVDDNGNLLVPAKTHSQGCATILVAALDPSITDQSGAYLCDCRVDHEDPWAEHAKGHENAMKLWALNEKLVEQEFEY